jgi:Rieske [2Fe-2S] domain
MLKTLTCTPLKTKNTKYQNAIDVCNSCMIPILKYIIIIVSLLSMTQDDFIEVARVNEIPDGKMKHVEVEGKEALIANVGGKFYAISDRCGHMNALLSMGNLTGSTVTCPFHGSKSD